MRFQAAKTLCAAFLMVGSLAHAGGVSVTAVPFRNLPGWENDNHTAALNTFIKSCDKARSNNLVTKQEWATVCTVAKTKPHAKAFFEMFFQPVLIENGGRTLFTGYYEPEIIGSRHKQGKFQYPIYRRPPEVKPGHKWKTRAQIESGLLRGRGLELAWLADPVENFFLHIQGSGRLKLIDGGIMRVGFNGKNGHKYRSVGKAMVRLGIMPAHKASAQRIKAWVRRNPVNGRKLLQANPSFVFFKELKNLSPDDGPLGALRIPVTAGRTLAVDQRYTPLGAPVWIVKNGPDPLRRLMVAQDVGSAIKGAQRADIFFGSGKDAGRIAGRTKSSGRMYTLLPIETARRLTPEG